jgi:pentatricopeptide repeat protein
MRDHGLQPDVVTYNSSLHCCGRHGCPDEAEALLAEMRAAGVAPDCHSYSCVLDACAKAGSVSDAMRVLAEMDEAGVAPNHMSYTSVMNACVHHSDAASLDQARPAAPRICLPSCDVSLIACISCSH